MRVHTCAYKYNKNKTKMQIDSEKLLEKKLREAVLMLGGLAVKFWSVSFTGFPDRVVLMPGGKISFVELKTTGKKPTPRQVYVIGLLKKLGFEVFVIDSKESLATYLKFLKG